MKKKRDPVKVRGPWIPLSLDFLRSRAWSELSPHGSKLLLDLCSGLAPNARGNGDLSAAPSVMQPKGWSSRDTLDRALKELMAANLLAITRRGNRRLCNLYAVTLWPIDCDMTKLDHGPGSYSTLDWEGATGDRTKPPTKDAPAKRKVLRKNENGAPATGQPPSLIAWPRDNIPAKPKTFTPASGQKGHISPRPVTPQPDTFLDMPSAGVRSAGVAGVAGVRDSEEAAERIDIDATGGLAVPASHIEAASAESPAGNFAKAPDGRVAPQTTGDLPALVGTLVRRRIVLPAPVLATQQRPVGTLVRRRIVLPAPVLATQQRPTAGNVFPGPWPRAVNE